MSSSPQTSICADFQCEFATQQKTILRIVDGFDYVKGGKLKVLARIQACQYELTHPPQYRAITHGQTVSGINSSIRENASKEFPIPRSITVEEAIEVAKALAEREKLAKN
jgi:hypothetical protein